MGVHEGEGWNGKSIREHVVAAQEAASEAINLVLSLREELTEAARQIENLQAELEAVRSVDQ